MNTPIQVYLAAPFFSADQLAAVERLELVMIGLGSSSPPSRAGGNIVTISPRLEPSAVEMNALIGKGGDPPSHLRAQVYTENITNISNSDLLVAITDDFDAGTLFEIGYASALRIPIVTFSARGYGSNLMLAESAFFHARTFGELANGLKDTLSWLRSHSPRYARVALRKAHHRAEPLKEGPADES